MDPSGYIDLVCFLDRLPSGKLTVRYGKWPIYRCFTFVIFYSYVSLPEGRLWRDRSG